MSQCHVCGAALREEHADATLSVFRCGACEHRQARHLRAATGDYYEHTPQAPAFLASLEETRRRQARELLARVTPRVGTAAPWLDFGCGRGWFLDEAARAGRPALAGFDSSALSRQWLADRGVAAPAPRADDAHWPDWSTSAVRPEVASLLDVVEHFEAPEAPLARLATELPTLRWAVVKVPISDGALFQVARRLRQVAPGPYRQLFQVGTTPPHWHYFSRASLARWAASLVDWRPALEWTDPDVDDLFGRVGALQGLPGGRQAARLLRHLPHDSALVLLERRAVSPRGG